MLRTTLLFLAPTVIAFACGFLVYLARETVEAWTVVSVFLLPSWLLSFIAAFLVGRRRSAFHILFFAAALLALFGIGLATAAAHFQEMKFIQDASLGLLLVSGAAAALCFVIAVPTSLLPEIRGRSKSTQPEPKSDLDLGFLMDRFASIRSSFTQVESAVTKETKRIEADISLFEESLRKRNRELLIAQTALADARREAEQYRELANLSKAQQDAFLRLLGKSKYIDYIVGFVLGILGSIGIEIVKATLTSAPK